MPRNVGLAACDADFVSIVDSDDWLESGALSAWLKLARENDLSFVIPRVCYDTGSFKRTPPIRRLRFDHDISLDPLRDRLIYRTNVFGLLSLSAIRTDRVVFDQYFSTGEDQAFAARLWFSGRRVGFAAGLPRYIQTSDAAGRISMMIRRPNDELAATLALLQGSWLEAQPLQVRQAIAAKCMRVHVFSSVASRVSRSSWKPGERKELADIVHVFLAHAPGFRSHLSRAEDRLLGVLCDPGISDMIVAEEYRRQRQLWNPLVYVPVTLTGLLAPDARVRLFAAKVFMSP
jgi:hypothetical protein